jgi:hypothetical protein
MSKQKIGMIVTLYQRELLKKNARLGTFCTQSVKEGLNSIIFFVFSGSELDCQRTAPRGPVRWVAHY